MISGVVKLCWLDKNHFYITEFITRLTSPFIIFFKSAILKQIIFVFRRNMKSKEHVWELLGKCHSFQPYFPVLLTNVAMYLQFLWMIHPAQYIMQNLCLGHVVTVAPVSSAGVFSIDSESFVWKYVEMNFKRIAFKIIPSIHPSIDPFILHLSAQQLFSVYSNWKRVFSLLSK